MNFSQKNATFTMLYYGLFHFFKVRKKCGVRWSRTPQMSALCGVRDRTLKTSVRVFTNSHALILRLLMYHYTDDRVPTSHTVRFILYLVSHNTAHNID